MKTLKLIFLLSLIGIYAQSQDLQYSQYCDEFHQISEGLYLCKNGKEINVSGVRLMAIDLFLEYKHECYNDSTFATYDWYQFFHSDKKYKVSPSIDPGFTPGYLGRWGIWEHKHPTFEDFLNWIENKYK